MTTREVLLINMEDIKRISEKIFPIMTRKHETTATCTVKAKRFVEEEVPFVKRGIKNAKSYT